MGNLFHFLIRQRAFFIYLFYALFSLWLLFTYNPYHQSVYFSSANSFGGGVYNVAGNITQYFGLKEVNQDLLQQNAQLSLEIKNLEDLIQDYHYKQVELDSAYKYDFVMAQVINNQLTQLENYITLNRGALAGIKPHMGVRNQNGVVGIVSVVSDHYAVVISLLNVKLRISAKVLGSDYFGSVYWDGKDPEVITLHELPRHIDYQIGDTVVTSGYSAAFPADVPIGIVEGEAEEKNDNFYALKVRLLTNFFALNDVRVIINNEQEEQLELEQSVLK